MLTQVFVLLWRRRAGTRASLHFGVVEGIVQTLVIL